MRYDAFISYSQASDQHIAIDVQREIQQMATPFWKKRTTRVFLDSSSLTAYPDMWEELAQSLDSTEYLVLLASEAAAESKWVNREIAHFAKRTGRHQNICVALTSGELAWDEETNDFSRSSTACPEELRGLFKAEPLFVDLRPWRNKRRGVRRRQSRHTLAAIVAKIRGVRKDDLVGAHIARQRRNLSLAAGAAIGLACLAIVSTVLYRNEAETSRKNSAQAVAALAAAESNNQLDRALLLGVAAHELADTDETRRGLFDPLARAVGVTAFIHSSGAPARTIANAPATGRVITASTDGTISIWDHNWQQLHTAVVVPGATIREVAITKDESAVYAVSDDGTISELKISTGTIVRRTKLDGNARTLALAADETVIYVAGQRLDQSIRIIDLKTFNEVGRIDVGFERVDSLAISASGQVLIVGGRRNMARDRAPVAAFEVATGNLLAETRDPSEQTVMGDSHDGCTSECLSSVWSVATHPMDKDIVLFGSNSGAVSVWNLRNGESRVIGFHDQQVARVRFSPDGTVAASTGFDHDVRYWDSDGWHQIGPVRRHHGSRVWDVAFDVAGQDVTVSDDGTFALGQAHSWRSALAEVAVSGHGELIGAVALAVEGGVEVLVVGRADRIDIVDAVSFAQIDSIGPLPGSVLALDVDRSNGTVFFGLASGEVGTWTRLDGTHRLRFQQTSLPQVGIAIHPDGEVFAAIGPRADGALVVSFRAASTLEQARDPIVIPDAIPSTVRFVNDGQVLLVGGAAGDAALLTWPDLQPLDLGLSATENVLGAATDHGMIAIGTDEQQVKVFTDSGLPVASLDGHGDVVFSVAFEPDGTRVASAGGDATVRLWDLGKRHGSFGPPLVGHTADVRDLMFSSTSGRLFSSSSNEILVWQLDDQQWPTIACDIASRLLSEDDWAQSVGTNTNMPDHC